MDFQTLVGKTFSENELYELLLFEFEENFEKHIGENLHFYFERTSDNRIQVTEIVSFKDDLEMDQAGRKIIEKFDRSGLASFIKRDSTHTQEWENGWADETPDEGPMTPEEIRQGCLELLGLFEDQMELQKLKPKKAV